MQTTKSKSTFYYLIYTFGVVLGVAFITLSIWADLEASFYGFYHRPSSRFEGLSCPIFMTPNETTSFSATITNTSDRTLSPTIKAEISSTGTLVTINEKISLEAGESKTLTWEIGPENIDLEHFAFANVYIYTFYPIQDSENNCGIFVLNLPGNGTVITWSAVILSVFSLSFGLYQLRKQQEHLSKRKNVFPALIFLTGLIFVGLLVAFIGSWVQGILILVVLAFLLLIIVGTIIKHL
ncbi:MAG: hypothetical protein UZ14_CFX002000515 [Chloroflexi bacterium OLB14]|nr:MAG: hypothetical protein UZ14_CFX002000515 [Chloroflexi bacterium OLB14]